MSNVFDNFNGDIRNWKSILIGTIVTIVNVAIIFLIDGFLLHPIPAPEGTFSFSGGSYAEFDLAEAGTGYSNDNIIDTYFPNDERIYLVRQGDELHLLEFRVHRYTKRDLPAGRDFGPCHCRNLRRPDHRYQRICPDPDQ